MLTDDQKRLVRFALETMSHLTNRETLEDLGMDEIDPYEWNVDDDVVCDSVLDARVEAVAKQFHDLSEHPEFQDA